MLGHFKPCSEVLPGPYYLPVGYVPTRLLVRIYIPIKNPSGYKPLLLTGIFFTVHNLGATKSGS